MLLLKEIKLLNFLSHHSTTVDFSNVHSLLISGRSGSGKSSVVDALVWTLYAKSRADNKSLIKRGTTNAKVTVVLYDDEDKRTYRVERTIDLNNKHELKIFEKEDEKKFVPIKTNGTKETQSYLEKNIVHASYILFCNSVVYLQDNPESFVSQTALNRKNILMEIVKASDYDEYLEKAKKELSKIKTNREVLLSKIDGEQTSIANNQNVADKLKEYEEEESRIKKEIETLKEEYKKYADRLEEINGQKMDITIAQETLKMKLKEYDKADGEFKRLNQELIDLSKIDVNALKEKMDLLAVKQKELEVYNESKDAVMAWNEKYSKILNSRPPKQDFELMIAEINKNLISVINEKANGCPKCGYIDPAWSQNHQERIKYQEELLNATTGRLEAYSEAVAECDRQEKELGKQPSLSLFPAMYSKLKEVIEELKGSEKDFAKVQNLEANKAKIEIQIKTATAEQGKLKEELEILMVEVGEKDFSAEESTLKNNIVKINGKIDELMMKHLGNQELLGVAKHAQKKIEESEIKLEEYKKDLRLTDENIETLELVKGAFGSNGIKAIVIDYLLPELEDRINNILGKLSDFRIELSTQKSGLGKDVTLEGLWINVINSEGEAMDYNQYSGGEKVKISISIVEALASLSKCNFRILDEAIVALDDSSIQDFLAAMENLLKNVSQVICISHINEIKSVFDEKIEIIKVNGNSTIKI
jgi:exonuclease SbcC